MRTFRAFCAAPVLLTVAALVAPAKASAQDLAKDWTSPAEISFEVGRPFFDGADEFSALSGFAYLSGVLGEGPTRFVFEIPFARGSLDGLGGSSSLLGSPFVGVVTRLSDEGADTPAGASLGLRIPVPEGFQFGDDDYAVGLAIFGDADRMEAFLTETATVSAAVRIASPVSPAVTLVGQFDADVLVFVGDGADERVEAFTGWVGRPASKATAPSVRWA